MRTFGTKSLGSRGLVVQCPIKACCVDIVSCSLGDLEMGADECVTLPFSPRVLVERR
jgi:hypothetical protein